MEEGGTYLEDFLLSLEMLPNDVRRDFELMKKLDKECYDLNAELCRQETVYLEQLHKQRKRKLGDSIATQDAINIESSSSTLLQDLLQLRGKTKAKLREKSAIASNMITIIERFSKKLDTDLAFFETELKGCGEFETQKGAEPGSEVAFSVKDDSHSERCLILGRVIFYHTDTAEYDILDVDDSKTYLLPEAQVTVLDLQDSQRKLSKGEEVYALYPDTTSFYQAVVSQAPRRTPAVGAEPCLVVQFLSDEDATGSIPHRTVPLKYAIRMADKATGTAVVGRSKSPAVDASTSHS